jgi:hypothetical protein
MNNWEVDQTHRDQLHWGDGTNGTWTLIKQWLQVEAARTRQLRGALPPFGGPETNPDAIPDLTISVNDGSPISIDPSNRSLVAVELRKEFDVFPEQFGSADQVMIQVMKAAAVLSQAEDAVIALGQGAAGFLASPGIGVSERNLAQQSASLFTAKQAVLPAERSVLEAILDGMQALQARGQQGPYCFIGAPDVYARAFRRLPNQVDPDIFSIRALLWDPSESGPDAGDAASTQADGNGGANGWLSRGAYRRFRYTRAVPAGTAVLLSLGGGSIYIAVPGDTTIGYVKEDRNVTLDARVRVRLLVNDQAAIQPLQ